MRLVVSSPAKLNLFLAITGRRADGFHDLVSVATPVEFGDTLTVDSRDDELAAAAADVSSVNDTNAGSAHGRPQFTLTCDEPTLEIDETNLILRAAHAFAAETGWKGGADFSLVKRIPMGAGLGGGSSNATAALIALNGLAGNPLDEAALTRLAAKLGSDCALFLLGGPVVMRGRGEFVEKLPAQAVTRLRGRRVLIFKPEFSISTVWAYRQLAAAAPDGYLPAPEAETQLANWIGGGGSATASQVAVADRFNPSVSDASEAPAEALLFNNMEGPAFTKFVALPVVLERLREEFALEPRMSGSGSACFAFLPEGVPAERVLERIRELWGPSAFVVETRLA